MIVRAARPEAKFLIISNDLARDERLSNAALGLLIRILSHPDNWRIDYRSLAQQCREGERAIRTSLAELREAGYAVLTKWQDERGRWQSQSTVYDAPQLPSSEASPQVAPSGGHRSPVHRSPVGRRLLEELEVGLEEGGEPSVRKETRARPREDPPPTPQPPPNPNPEPATPAAGDGGIPPRRCPEHLRALGPVPACGACKEARIAAEQWERTHPVSAANARTANAAPKHPECPECGAPAPAGTCGRCARTHKPPTPRTVSALRDALPRRQRGPAGRQRECPHGRPVAWLDAAETVEACPDCRRGSPAPENAAESLAVG